MKAVLCKAFGPPESLLPGIFFGAWSIRCVSEATENFTEILELFERGKINPLVGSVYPLEQYADALRCLSERKAIGKVVVKIQ